METGKSGTKKYAINSDLNNLIFCQSCCLLLSCSVLFFFSSEQYSAFVFLRIMTAYILDFTAVWVYKTSALHIRNRMIPVTGLIL